MLKNSVFSAIILFTISSSFAQSKIAHLNSNEVLTAMPSYQLAIKNLETYQNDVQKEIQLMMEDFFLSEQSLINRRDGLSPVVIQIEEDNLRKKSEEITTRQQSAQLEIETYAQELNRPILEKVENAVKIVSDRHQYDYVFDISTTMIHNGPDITKEVIEEILKLE